MWLFTLYVNGTTFRLARTALWHKNCKIKELHDIFICFWFEGVSLFIYETNFNIWTTIVPKKTWEIILSEISRWPAACLCDTGDSFFRGNLHSWRFHWIYSDSLPASMTLYNTHRMSLKIKNYYFSRCFETVETPRTCWTVVSKTVYLGHLLNVCVVVQSWNLTLKSSLCVKVGSCFIEITLHPAPFIMKRGTQSYD